MHLFLSRRVSLSISGWYLEQLQDKMVVAGMGEEVAPDFGTYFKLKSLSLPTLISSQY